MSIMQVQMMWAWTIAQFHYRRDERGQSVVGYVIVIAFVAALAIAIGVIVTSKVTSKANSINLGGNSGSTVTTGLG